MQNRSLVDTDLVVWYVMGVTHDPRPEDWPVMPVAYHYNNSEKRTFFYSLLYLLLIKINNSDYLKIFRSGAEATWVF